MRSKIEHVLAKMKLNFGSFIGGVSRMTWKNASRQFTAEPLTNLFPGSQTIDVPDGRASLLYGFQTAPADRFDNYPALLHAANRRMGLLLTGYLLEGVNTPGIARRSSVLDPK